MVQTSGPFSASGVGRCRLTTGIWWPLGHKGIFKNRHPETPGSCDSESRTESASRLAKIRSTRPAAEKRTVPKNCFQENLSGVGKKPLETDSPDSELKSQFCRIGRHGSVVSRRSQFHANSFRMRQTVKTKACLTLFQGDTAAVLLWRSVIHVIDPVKRNSCQ